MLPWYNKYLQIEDMNRTIKFRGKDLKTDKWVYGSLLQDDYGTFQLVDFIDHHETWHDIDPDTVGQFTGLHDRTGKEIYEGDVLEYCSGIDSFGGIFQTVRIEYRANEGGYVGINQYCNTRDKREIVQNIVRCLNKCIICGTIHDNPELMEKV